MQLSDVRTLCAESASTDWNVITRRGGRSGPSYLDDLTPTQTGGRGGSFTLDHREHRYRAAYKPDVRLTVGYGLHPDSLPLTSSTALRPEPWTEVFPDPAWAMHFCDFFYCGALVERCTYAAVDGGRCILPVPLHAARVERWQLDWCRVLNGILDRLSDFDDYLHRSGLTPP